MIKDLQGQLHDFRKEIDSNIKKAGSFKIVNRDEDSPDERSKCQREMALAHTKLQEAKMWVGKCLEAIGSEFPENLRDEAKPDREPEISPE